MRQLSDPNLVGDVRRALAETGLDPSLLTLEMTESVLAEDVDEVLPRMCALKDLGVRLAIDDFGTGYSSLAYLRRFPVDIVKIDKAFIDGMATGKSGERRSSGPSSTSGAASSSRPWPKGSKTRR